MPSSQPTPRLIAALTIAALMANLAAAVPTMLVSDILTGPAAMNGSARGTALIMTILAVPLAAICMWFEREGSRRAEFAGFGAFLYLAYNNYLLLTATPFNRLFLVYAASMALTILVLWAKSAAADPHELADLLPRVPARGLTIFVWIIVAFNLMAWLRTALPAVMAPTPTSFLEGTGLVTHPVFVQDLSFWLPFAAVIGGLLWLRRPWGVFLGGAWLVYGVLEGIGVATDQYLGSSADPTSTQVSFAAVPLFIVLALVTLAPLYYYFRRAAESPAERAGRRLQARPMHQG